MMYLLSATRSLLATPIIVISIVIYGSLAIIMSAVTWGRPFFPTFFTISWSRFVVWLMGIEITYEGKEHIPEQSCMFVFNHASLIDIPILNAKLTNNIRFGAKASLYKIPIFGQAVASFGTIKIERGDRQKVIKEYKKSLVRVKKQGVSIILAAEGTRNPNPPQMMPFKSGPFILAIQGQMPVVPIVLDGVDKVLPKHTYFMPFGPWKRKVKLTALKPIPTEGLKFDDRSSLKEIAQTVMSQTINDSL